MATMIHEAAKVETLTGNRQLITIITPGQGSSGYYPAEALEKAAKDRVFPAGTQMHIDHDGEMSKYENPAGTLTRLASALTEDAWWDPNYVDKDTGTKGRLAAEAKVFPRWREDLAEMKDFIGVSINAAAKVKRGEIDGKQTVIVEELLPDVLNRVDYVTVAGRGGKIEAILESALTRRIDEATANDTRTALSSALAETYPEAWPYVLDYDPDEGTVWYGVEDNLGSAMYQRSFTTTDEGVSFSGDPIEVRIEKKYVPVSPPASSGAAEAADPTPTPAVVKENQAQHSTKENKLPEITIEETRLRTLEESHGRVPALEARATEAENRAVAAERRAAVAESTVRARDFAAKIIHSANADLSESVVARIVDAATTEIPLTENLQLDTDALTETVNEARQKEETYLAVLAKESGLGQVRGITSTDKTAVQEVTDADILAIRSKGGK